MLVGLTSIFSFYLQRFGLQVLNSFSNKQCFLRVCNTSLLKTLRKKGEIARKRAISAFLIVFSTRLENFLPFQSNFKLLAANSRSLEESKMCRLRKGLNTRLVCKGLTVLHKWLEGLLQCFIIPFLGLF